jgi:hypothetical protein
VSLHLGYSFIFVVIFFLFLQIACVVAVPKECSVYLVVEKYKYLLEELQPLLLRNKVLGNLFVSSRH